MTSQPAAMFVPGVGRAIGITPPTGKLCTCSYVVTMSGTCAKSVALVSQESNEEGKPAQCTFRAREERLPDLSTLCPTRDVTLNQARVQPISGAWDKALLTPTNPLHRIIQHRYMENRVDNGCHR